MMKIMLTGANGFLASNLLSHFKKINCELLLIDKKKNTNIIKNSKFKFKKIDISKKEHLKKIKNYKIDLIIHTAAVQPIKKIKDFKSFYNGNVQSTYNLIDTFGKKVNKIIYSSSFSIYNTNLSLKNIKETNKSQPRNFYGLTKKISEDLLIHFSKIFNYKLVILRFDGIFGKNQNLPGFINTCFQLMQKDKKIEIFNKGANKRDHIYVDDCSQAIIKSVQLKSKKNEIINIAGGRPIAQQKIAQFIKKKLNSKSKIILSKKKNKNFSGDVYMNIDKARKILKFKPKDIFYNLNLMLKQK